MGHVMSGPRVIRPGARADRWEALLVSTSARQREADAAQGPLMPAVVGPCTGDGDQERDGCESEPPGGDETVAADRMQSACRHVHPFSRPGPRLNPVCTDGPLLLTAGTGRPERHGQPPTAASQHRTTTFSTGRGT